VAGYLTPEHPSRAEGAGVPSVDSVSNGTRVRKPSRNAPRESGSAVRRRDAEAAKVTGRILQGSGEPKAGLLRSKLTRGT
jgi:hypothetical protein